MDYWFSTAKMTVLVASRDGVITDAAPIVHRFVNQPLDNLERWMRKQPGFRKEILNWEEPVMATSFSHVTLVGNITRAPELHFLPTGTAVIDFGLAVNDSYKDASGQWVDNTIFFDVSCFGKAAESGNERLAKGSHVLVDGRLKQDSWTDKATGQRRTKLKVIAEKALPLEKREAQQSAQQPAPQQQPATGFTEADVPF